MEMLHPLVSVLIPAYKDSFFEAALASACRQSYDNIEIIVCDDSRGQIIENCVETSRAKCDFPLRYFRNVSVLGELFNTLKTIEYARGKYIKFLHDDDVLHPDSVAELVAAMERDPSVSIASSRRQLIDDQGQPVADILPTSFPFDGDVVIDGPELISFLVDHTLNFIGEPSCLMVRRADLLEMGDQLMSLNGCLTWWVRDLSLCVKLMRLGNLALLEKPLTNLRVSTEQFSQRGRDQPGIGNQGHNDFRQHIRELGWYTSVEGKRLVSVAPLHEPGAFRKVDILEQLKRTFANAQAMLQQRQWLAERVPSAAQRRLIDARLEQYAEAPSIGVIVLDLEGRHESLRETLDSLERAAQSYPALKIVVLSPVMLLENLAQGARYVPLQSDDHVGQINQIVEDSEFGWFLLAEAGVQFTPSGLLVAGLELLPDAECQAVFCDAMLRQENGELSIGLRPDFQS